MRETRRTPEIEPPPIYLGTLTTTHRDTPDVSYNCKQGPSQERLATKASAAARHKYKFSTCSFLRLIIVSLSTNTSSFNPLHPAWSTSFLLFCIFAPLFCSRLRIPALSPVYNFLLHFDISGLCLLLLLLLLPGFLL